jgi:hypothetical protein
VELSSRSHFDCQLKIAGCARNAALGLFFRSGAVLMTSRGPCPHPAKGDDRALDRRAQPPPTVHAAVTLPKGHSIYRDLRADRRTAFDARLWLAAAARFDTLGGFTRDALFETRKTLGALSGRASTIAAGASCLSAIAAGASCSSAIAAGASSSALVSTATVSWIKRLDVA